MGISVYGGWFVGETTGIVTSNDFIAGARSTFRGYTFFFAMAKSYSFSFIIATVSSYQGYHAGGSSLEVGRASTRAVVYSCVLILIADFILAKLLL